MEDLYFGALNILQEAEGLGIGISVKQAISANIWLNPGRKIARPWHLESSLKLELSTRCQIQTKSQLDAKIFQVFGWALGNLQSMPESPKSGSNPHRNVRVKRWDLILPST